MVGYEINIPNIDDINDFINLLSVRIKILEEALSKLELRLKILEEV